MSYLVQGQTKKKQHFDTISSLRIAEGGSKTFLSWPCMLFTIVLKICGYIRCILYWSYLLVLAKFVIYCGFQCCYRNMLFPYLKPHIFGLPQKVATNFCTMWSLPFVQNHEQIVNTIYIGSSIFHTFQTTHLRGH